MFTVNTQLIIHFEGKAIQTLPLTMPVLSIGRTPENGLALPDKLVSRTHAELRLGAQGAILTDLGSSNGTFVDNQRLLPNQPRMLAEGARFRIGPYTITYQAMGTAASTTQQETEPQPVQPRSVPERPTVVADSPAVVFSTGLPVTPQTVQPFLKPASDKSGSIYQHFLPDIFQENDFLKRFLLIFESIWEPLEQRQDHIAMYFDPRTCPASFLPWLASWLGLSFQAHWPEGRKRRLLAQAMEIYRWRGTRYGLIRIIEICTGLTPVITEQPSQPFIFHIRITLPPGYTRKNLDRDLIENLIQMHKPAHAGYVLEVHL